MYLRARRVVMGVDHGPLYHSPFPSRPLYTPSHPPNCGKRWPVRIWIATDRPGCPSTNISQKRDHYFVDPIVLSAWKATSVKIIMHQSAPECSSRV